MQHIHPMYLCSLSDGEIDRIVYMLRHGFQSFICCNSLAMTLCLFVVNTGWVFVYVCVWLVLWPIDALYIACALTPLCASFVYLSRWNECFSYEFRVRGASLINHVMRMVRANNLLHRDSGHRHTHSRTINVYERTLVLMADH